ncbi:unnamed protein product, partial [Rotaria magnacalcarata]
TKAQSICKDYEVQGYPTIKYFSFGKLVADYPGARTEEGFFEFMNNPDEALSKPQAETPKSDP